MSRQKQAGRLEHKREGELKSKDEEEQASVTMTRKIRHMRIDDEMMRKGKKREKNHNFPQPQAD